MTPEHLQRGMSDPFSRALSVVDQALREAFPDNYWKRCTYAAFGLHTLLKDNEVATQIVFGDMMCFTLSPDASKPGMAGYGNAGAGAPAHFWVEAGGSLLDLGPHYLPCDALRPIVSMPLIRWPLDEPMPLYLRYLEKGRGHADVRPEPSMSRQVADFIERCRALRHSAVDASPPPAWQLTGTPSLRSAADNGDIWARGALRWSSRVKSSVLPF